MYIADFDYELPPELIAREPSRPRDASRMLALDRRTGRWIDSGFRRLPDFLNPSDVLVLNDTRVIPARVMGALVRRAGTGREVEVLFVAPAPDGWDVLCRPGRRVRAGDRIVFGNSRREGVFGEVRQHGLRRLHVDWPVDEFLQAHGRVPLPPYIRRENTPADAADYQTIYAAEPGAVAAPTAGLHFTPAVFDELRNKGIEIVKITLHVGIGTFIPVRSEDPKEHVLQPERFRITAEAASRLNSAREHGRRIVAVGTTSVRVLEHAIRRGGRFHAQSGEVDLFILPGYEFKAVDAMLTNFHLPKSTLIMLASAFASRENILCAYRHAVLERYRFYSYGDCMFIGDLPR